jgi:hypothetical protein
VKFIVKICIASFELEFDGAYVLLFYPSHPKKGAN